jgi:IclR family pca regulon transcriptional regulator
MNDRDFVNSLQRGLAILEAFTRERPRQNLQQLTQATSLPKTTVLRLLRTLISLGYVRLDSAAREYSLGPRVMSLGYATLSGMELREIARPYLEDLSRQSEQNVNLAILDGTEAIYIERITRTHLISTDHTVGSRVNTHSTAIGRAMLAFLEEDELNDTLGRLYGDPETAKHLRHERESFCRLLKAVRRNGYALNNEEYIVGIRAVGAPIFNAGGRVEAAINMPVFSKGVSMKDLTERLAPMIVNTALEISATLGYVKPA